MSSEFEEAPQGEDLLPEEEASQGAIQAAQRFFVAVESRDYRGLWDMFSDNARAYVLNIAMEHGMDFDLGSRIRSGAASDEEMEEYLTTLLEGIRFDLRGVELSRLLFESTAEPYAALQVRVTYLLQMQEQIGDVTPAIPAGSLIMILEGGQWKVERLVPRPG